MSATLPPPPPPTRTHTLLLPQPQLRLQSRTQTRLRDLQIRYKNSSGRQEEIRRKKMTCVTLVRALWPKHRFAATRTGSANRFKWEPVITGKPVNRGSSSVLLVCEEQRFRSVVTVSSARMSFLPSSPSPVGRTLRALPVLCCNLLIIHLDGWTVAMINQMRVVLIDGGIFQGRRCWVPFFYSRSVCLPACLPACLSVCLSVCLFARLFVCLFVCLFCRLTRTFSETILSFSCISSFWGVQVWMIVIKSSDRTFFPHHHVHLLLGYPSRLWPPSAAISSSLGWKLNNDHV